MTFEVLDIEKTPPEFLIYSQDIVIATNAIHATRNLRNSCSNTKKMLMEHGFLCLIEITRNLYWYDVVFGLLEGWWLFEDMRDHAIAHESQWKEVLLEAGFEHVHWSEGDSDESNQIRVIAAISCDTPTECKPYIDHQSDIMIETLFMQEVDKIPLYADVHYSSRPEAVKGRRPIGK